MQFDRAAKLVKVSTLYNISPETGVVQSITEESLNYQGKGDIFNDNLKLFRSSEEREKLHFFTVKVLMLSKIILKSGIIMGKSRKIHLEG